MSFVTPSHVPCQSFSHPQCQFNACTVAVYIHILSLSCCRQVQIVNVVKMMAFPRSPSVTLKTFGAPTQTHAHPHQSFNTGSPIVQEIVIPC